MKKVLIIAGISDNGRSTDYEKYFSQYIKDYEFRQVHFDRLLFELSPGTCEISILGRGEPVKNYDLVVIREYSGAFLDMAYVISRYLKDNNVPFVNHNYLVYRPVSKLAQAHVFYSQKVNFPDTVFALKPENLIEAAGTFGFPFILKDRLGMHGSDNYLINSGAEALEALSNKLEIKFVAQKYLPNSHDYRVLVMGGLEPLQIKRTAAGGSHLNNTSQGGTGSLVVELPPEVIADSKKLAEAFSIDIGGVDVLQNEDDGQYYFLEVNNQPQLATGAEVPSKMKKFKEYLDNSI